MIYSVALTAPAQNDLLKNAAYISDNLLNPIAANKFLDDVTENLRVLEETPLMYAKVNDEMLSALGVRMLKINNYLKFYRVNETQHVVTVLRIVHEKRDWQQILI